MKVKVIKSFKDLEANVTREPKDNPFDTTIERGKLLIAKGFVEEVKASETIIEKKEETIEEAIPNETVEVAINKRPTKKKTSATR